VAGSDIFGYDPSQPEYMSLMYPTGPGHRPAPWTPREEPGLREPDFRFPATAFRGSGAHQGEEVGPWHCHDAIMPSWHHDAMME
jgi:hypothetical protein